MKHKCRVFKSHYQGFNSGRLVWLAHCYNEECYYYEVYIWNRTWNETVTDAMIHRFQNR
jgi:hypothetical protein